MDVGPRTLNPAARLLFIDQSGELGGAELSLLDIASHYQDRCRVLLFDEGPFSRRLVERGVAVEVAAAGRGVTAVGKRGGAWGQIRAVPAAAGLTRRVARRCRDADLVVANTQKAFVIGAAASRLARRPIVWHLRDMLSRDHFDAMNRRLVVGLANRLAAGVIANSHATADSFVAAGGRRELVRVVHNAVDVAPFDAVTCEEVERLRGEFGDVSGGEPTTGAQARREAVEASVMANGAAGENGHKRTATMIGIFGRLSPWKGQDVVIRAAAKLPNVQVVIVGGALFGESGWAASLQRLAAELGMVDRVHFAGFREDVPALMKAVDVVVHASTAPEPFGRVIVEGMLADRPVIASNAGGARELIEHGRTGLLTEVGDPAALAAALDQLREDPDLVSRLTAAAAAHARRAFGLPRLFRQLDQTWARFSSPAPMRAGRGGGEGANQVGHLH